MSELLRLFQDLSKFYEPDLTWEVVDKIYTNEIELRAANSDDSDEPLAKRPALQTSIEQLAFVRQKYNTLPILKELTTYVRNLRTETQDSYDNTYDNWVPISRETSRNAYMAFVYGMASLTLLEPQCAEMAKISLTVINTYFLTLTIPGAKNAGVFEEAVIEHCLQVFDVLENIKAPNIWFSFVILLDDLKIVFRLVHFQNNIPLRNSILRRIIDILYMNYKQGYANANAKYLHTKCFEVFNEVINSHNGDMEETLMLIMNRTVLMHTYADRPKGGTVAKSNEDFEHISDWFIDRIPKSPERLANVLSFYIEWVVTNPLSSWKMEETHRAMDIAAKYDAALFEKCNKSCAEFLFNALSADDSAIRVRAIELIGRILLVESHVLWKMFRYELTTVPREVFLIKALLESLKDCHNNARLRAAQALQTALVRGSENTRKVLTECIQYAPYHFADERIVLPGEPLASKNELRFKEPSALPVDYSFVGHEQVEDTFLQMPECVYARFYRCSLSNLRRAGIMFMEQVVKVNPLIIYHTHFVKETIQLATDPVAMVRKQAMNSADALLQSFPNCFPIICVWCRIWACMLSDADPKNIEIAVECFRQRVLLNLRGIEDTNKPEYFMPWVIVRELLNTQPRQYLQICIQKALQERSINQEVLSIIESHLLASTSSEAWALLNLISSKVPSKEPDTLLTHFTTHQKWNAEINMGICLEVLINCLPQFSHAALNVVFEYVLQSIREGRVLLSLIAKAMDFLVQIDRYSRAKSNSNQLRDDWLQPLHDELLQSIYDGIANFPENRYTFQGLLGAYSEVVTMLPERIDRSILLFVQKYMTKCAKLTESQYDTENERILNYMIVIATRLSLRDYEDASNTCKIYKNILHNNDRPQIVNTIIVSLSDLGKRHTQLVEDMFPNLLRKLESPYAFNRIATFKCFEIMVMQDQIKLRGTVMLALLSTIVDESYKVAQLAAVFFNSYIKSKNATLFQKCLAECPFVLNEYKNFTGMDTFQGAAIKSPLKGAIKRQSRRLLYNHFMASIEDIYLVAHFEQLKLIAEKSKVDALLKTDSGQAVVQDVLFILRRICYITKKTKAGATGEKDDEDKDEDNAEPTEAFTTAENPQTSSGATGRGRSRKQQKLTMQDALRIFEHSLVYIHTIYVQLADVMNDTLQHSFDQLCKALFKRFPSYVQYAQPAKFWDKYRKSKTASAKRSAKRSKEPDTPANEVTNATVDSEGDSDNELPIARHHANMQSLDETRDCCDDLLTEYVFNPIR